MNKPELLKTIRTQRAEVQALWTDLSDEQMTQRPGPQPDWSAKDTIAHITFWEQRMLDSIRAMKAGEQPDWTGDIDGVNARAFADHKDQPLADVLGDFRRSGEEVIQALESLPESDIFEAGRFAPLQGDPLIGYIAGNTYGHYDEHAESLREWRAQIEA